MPIPYLPIVDRLTKEVFYRLMWVTNAVFSKMQPLEKALKLLRACLERGFGPIRRPIEVNVLYNLSYVPTISPNLHDQDANHNVADIAIVSKTEI